jgi:hypothetical protein
MGTSTRGAESSYYYDDEVDGILHSRVNGDMLVQRVRDDEQGDRLQQRASAHLRGRGEVLEPAAQTVKGQLCQLPRQRSVDVQPVPRFAGK